MSPRPARPFRISEMPRALRPRERLKQAGPRAMGNAELLSVVLGTGRRGRSALALGEALLRRYGLKRLPELGIEDWSANSGVGTAQACRLTAVFELGRRVWGAVLDEAPTVSCPGEVYGQVAELRRARREHLVALYLDAQNALIAKETLSVGSLNTTRTHPREVLYPAIRHLAVGFVLAHNHPSGNLRPSRDDVDFTRSIRRAAELMGFELYDHLVVGATGYVSLKERGLL